MKRLLLLLLILFAVTACTSSAPKERPLYLGTEGIVMGFPRENAKTYYEEELFTVSVRLENDGASHVKEGWLTAVYDPAVLRFVEGKTGTGLDPAGRTLVYDAKADLPMLFSLKGREQFVSVGEVDYADFTFATNNVSGNRDKAVSSISFQACYPYTTTFIGTICIDRDVYNTQATKICLERSLSGSSQGAPVAVTRVEPTFLYRDNKVSPRFKITLTNLKNGYTLWDAEQVRRGQSKELCDQAGFSRREFGGLNVSASINNVQLDCSTSSSNPDGFTRFDSNTAEILCTYPPVEPGANYEAPLVVQAQYFYVSSLTAALEVTNV